jgi:hypothetical protein
MHNQKQGNDFQPHIRNGAVYAAFTNGKSLKKALVNYMCLTA